MILNNSEIDNEKKQFLNNINVINMNNENTRNNNLNNKNLNINKKRKIDNSIEDEFKKKKTYQYNIFTNSDIICNLLCFFPFSERWKFKLLNKSFYLAFNTKYAWSNLDIRFVNIDLFNLDFLNKYNKLFFNTLSLSISVNGTENIEITVNSIIKHFKYLKDLRLYFRKKNSNFIYEGVHPIVSNILNYKILKEKKKERKRNVNKIKKFLLYNTVNYNKDFLNSLNKKEIKDNYIDCSTNDDINKKLVKLKKNTKYINYMDNLSDVDKKCKDLSFLINSSDDDIDENETDEENEEENEIENEEENNEKNEYKIENNKINEKELNNTNKKIKNEIEKNIKSETKIDFEDVNTNKNTNNCKNKKKIKKKKKSYYRNSDINNICNVLSYDFINSDCEFNDLLFQNAFYKYINNKNEQKNKLINDTILRKYIGLIETKQFWKTKHIKEHDNFGNLERLILDVELKGEELLCFVGKLNNLKDIIISKLLYSNKLNRSQNIIIFTCFIEKMKQNNIRLIQLGLYFRHEYKPNDFLNNEKFRKILSERKEYIYDINKEEGDELIYILQKKHLKSLYCLWSNDLFISFEMYNQIKKFRNLKIWILPGWRALSLAKQ